ncbi:hypothetical protein [Ornithinimicrobium kibberense]|uniref:hypothetical protein n=1 Tax=Ornithinimicrobium kibberense TaxID=282060 RepID=UPI0036197472
MATGDQPVDDPAGGRRGHAQALGQLGGAGRLVHDVLEDGRLAVRQVRPPGQRRGGPPARVQQAAQRVEGLAALPGPDPPAVREALCLRLDKGMTSWLLGATLTHELAHLVRQLLGHQAYGISEGPAHERARASAHRPTELDHRPRRPAAGRVDDRRPRAGRAHPRPARDPAGRLREHRGPGPAR